VEAIFHGNDNVRQAGLVLLGLQPAPRTSPDIKPGTRKTSGEDLSGYIGIELARDF
jgi:hypothetical protein